MMSCQFSSVIGCNATANPQQVVAKLHCFDLLWICCGLGGGFRFVVQHLDMSRCCGFVVDARFMVDLSWICCRRHIYGGLVVDLLYSFRFVVDLSWICCGVVQLVVQQIKNKWSLTFTVRSWQCHNVTLATPLPSQQH